MSDSIIANSPFSYKFSKTQKYGLTGELWAADQLVKHGYASRMVSDWLADVDLIIDGHLPCEVKIARPTIHQSRPGYYRQRWQWNIRQLSGIDLVVIAIAEDDCGDRFPFIIPSAVLIARTQIQITSHPTRYSGYLTPFLHNWSIVSYLLDQHYRQAGQLALPIFEEVYCE